MNAEPSGKMNYKESKDATHPPARTTRADAETAPSNSFRLFSKSTVHHKKLACPYCLFRFCRSLRTTSSSSWRFS